MKIVEFATVTLVEGRVKFHLFSAAEIDALLKENEKQLVASATTSS
jgi:hypothetical protein